MAWKLKDEWIDLAAARHVVIFHNPDVLVQDYRGGSHPVPQEHHLIYEFGPWLNHETGEFKPKQPVIEDFGKHKSDTLTKLEAHHRVVMQHREAQKHARLGTGPKA